jgi:hypothetical protein
MSQNESDRPGRWHLDRRVSIGHLVTTAAVGASALLWLTNVESRVALNAQAVDAGAQRLDRIESRQTTALAELKAEIREGFAATRTDLRALAARLDRQLERPAD